MNDAQISSSFAAAGFVVIEGFLTADRCARLRLALARHQPELIVKHAVTGYDLACDAINRDPLGAGDPDLVALANDADFVAVTTAVLGSGWKRGGSLVMWLAPGGRGQAWHQDCRADGGRFNCNRLLYTADIEASDGAVVVVPGSHRLGRVPAKTAQEDLPGQVVLTPRAGTLVLLHGRCWHRVTPNRSQRERVSINIRAFPAGTPTDWDKVAVFRDAEVDFTTGTAISVASDATPMA